MKTDIYYITTLTESQSRDFFEKIRWPNGPVCVHCGHNKAYVLDGESTRNGLYKCASCRKHFTVTMGTPLEDTHVSLGKWILAIYLMIQSKKGISALQLKRMIGGSYKTSWYMCHRIREMMKELDPQVLNGIVEVDETYVGGKPRKGSGQESKRGRGTKKIPVMAMIERGGASKVEVVLAVDGATLKGNIKKHVDPKSRIVTDEWKGYKGIGKDFQGGHQAVNHGKGEYARGDVHTNTAESFFSLLKRGVYGTFHHVSQKHLFRYATEFSFRWSMAKSKIDDQMRMVVLGGENRRITYKYIVGKEV